MVLRIITVLAVLVLGIVIGSLYMVEAKYLGLVNRIIDTCERFDLETERTVYSSKCNLTVESGSSMLWIKIGDEIIYSGS